MTSEQYKELLLLTLNQSRYVRGIPVEGSYPQQYDTDLPIVHLTSIEDIQGIGTLYPSKCYFSLVQDIDAEGHIYHPVNIVEGHFNGNGHKISNLKIQMIDNPEFEDIYGSIFRTVSLSTVENLIIENMDATALIVSGIASKALNSTLLNCQVAGKLYGMGVGGIVAQSIRSNLLNCSALLDSTANSFAGIVNQSQDSFVQGCSFNGTVLAEAASGIMLTDTGGSRVWQSSSLGEFYPLDQSTESEISAIGILGEGIGTEIQDCFSRPIFHIGFDNTSGIVGRLHAGEVKRSYTTDPTIFIDSTGTTYDYVYNTDLTDCATFANFDLDEIWLCNDGNYLELRVITNLTVPETSFIEINSYNDLVSMTPSGAYILMADIDLTGVAFEPIDLTDGYFNGNNHSISNLLINSPAEDYVGLFSRIAMVSNLTLSGEVIGQDYVGLIAGEMTLGAETMINCFPSGMVSGRNYVGGATGAGKNISASSFDGNVSASGNFVGGFVGSGTEITKTHVTANVLGVNYVGGLMGSGTATKSSAIGNVSGYNRVGGFAGSTSVSLDCFSRGDTEGNEDVGGFVGVYSGFLIVAIRRCYCVGNTTGNDNVGGFVGRKAFFSGQIEDAYYRIGASDRYAIGLADAQMRCPNNFGWDYLNVWECIEGAYPSLREYPVIISETTELPFDITMNLRVLDVEYPGYIINEWVKSRDIFVYEDIHTHKLVLSRHDYSSPIIQTTGSGFSPWGAQGFYGYPQLKEGWEWRGGKAINLVNVELIRLNTEIRLLKQREADLIQKIEMAQGGTENIEAILTTVQSSISDLTSQFTELYLHQSLRLPEEDRMYIALIS